MSMKQHSNMRATTWPMSLGLHEESVKFEMCAPTELANNAELLNAFFQACGPSLAQMELRGYDNKSEQAYDLIVEQIAEHSHHLQELTLTGGFPENPHLLHQLCLRCPYINKLTFNECMSYTGDQNKGLSFFALHKFETTDTQLSDALLVAIASGSANLQEFRLINASGVSTTGLETVAANCPLLHTVRLIGMYTEDADVLPFVTRCKKLPTIEVTEPNDMFTDASLTAIAENSPFLHTPHLAECGGISDSGVKDVLENCTNLRDLSLTGDMLLTNDTLYSIAEHCPLLITLNIEGGTYFSDVGLGAVAEGCTALQRVTFSTHGELTEESADVFGPQVEVVCEEWFSDYAESEIYAPDADDEYDWS